MDDAQKLKQRAIERLTCRYREQTEQLTKIEPRLAEYYEGLICHSSVVEGDPNDWHNVNELLGAIRLLRFLRTYEFNDKKVAQAIYDGEGEWKQDGKRWRHIKGGVKQPGREGPTVYRWEPFQIFALCAIYGPMAWIDTENDADSRDLLPTEKVIEGRIFDLRRLCTRFILYGPRKINKTGFSSFVLTEDFMRGDYDAQLFCTANSLDQAKILYRKAQDMIRCFDPQEKRIRFTATETNWREGQFRAAQMKALPAGGKIPDGWFASTVAPDEYGSAGYTNGRSDMGQTVATAESSMGPRREPLTVITTTASLITAGPFMEILEATHKMLARELEIDEGKVTVPLAEDRQMMLLLEPDEWERKEEYLLTSKSIRRKINPMLGLIAQHSFYDTQVAESRMDDTKKKETIAKLFNVYQGEKVKSWVVTADDIRKLQRPRHITDCIYQAGWNVFVGLDFSGGEDLFAMSMLAVNYSPGLEMKDRFFADTYLWILEHSLNKSPNRPFFEQLIEKGWLRVCPGKVFNPDYAINELMSLNKSGVNLVMFGYDPAQSHDPINTIKAWLQNIGISAAVIKEMVVPVNQGFMTMNPLVQKFERMVLSKVPWLHFSENPLWAWMTGNAVLIYSRDETLCRLQKGGEHKKIDGLAALMDAIAVFDMSESKISQ